MTLLLKNKTVQLTARLDTKKMMMIQGQLHAAVTEGRCCLITSHELWHRRMGHPADGILTRMQDAQGHKLIDNTKQAVSKDCETCLQTKQPQVSFQRSESRASRQLELIHADLMDFGEDILSHGGGRYVLVLLDDYSRYTAISILSTKDETAQEMVDRMRNWETQTGKKVKKIRTDNGSEFKGVLTDHLRHIGADHQMSTAYTPQHNGRVERVNRTLADKMRALLFDAEAPDEFWAEALNTANELRNASYMDTVKGVPYELFYQKKLQMNKFRIFGCLAYVHVPEAHRKGKLAPRGEAGIFVGYEPLQKAWRIAVQEDNRWYIITSCDVKFIEQSKQGYLAVTGDRQIRTAPTPVFYTGHARHDPEYKPSDTDTDRYRTEDTMDWQVESGTTAVTTTDTSRHMQAAAARTPLQPRSPRLQHEPAATDR